MRGLKKIVRKRLPGDSSLREVIIMEADEITREQFLAKACIWLRLLSAGVK